jgi:hypothetical protein
MGGTAGVRHTHPALEQPEIRPPCRVQGHDLAVEDDTAATQESAHRLQLGVRDGDITACPGGQVDRTVAFSRQDTPRTVPFDLERPVLVPRGQRPRRGQHRRDIRRGEPGAPGIRSHTFDD